MKMCTKWTVWILYSVQCTRCTVTWYVCTPSKDLICTLDWELSSECITMRCTSLHCTVHCPALHHNKLDCTKQHSTILQYSSLYHMSLHYIFLPLSPSTLYVPSVCKTALSEELVLLIVYIPVVYIRHRGVSILVTQLQPRDQDALLPAAPSPHCCRA